MFVIDFHLGRREVGGGSHRISIPGFELGPYRGGSRGVGGGVLDGKGGTSKTLEGREKRMGELCLD